MEATEPRKSHRQAAMQAKARMEWAEHREFCQDTLLGEAVTAGGKKVRCATFLRPKLFEKRGDGAQINLPEDFWEVLCITHGPYLDDLEQEVFLCRVGGIDIHGEEVNGIVWEQQAADLPGGMLHDFMDECAAAGMDTEGYNRPPQHLIDEAYANAEKHLFYPSKKRKVGAACKTGIAQESESQDAGRRRLMGTWQFYHEEWMCKPREERVGVGRIASVGACIQTLDGGKMLVTDLEDAGTARGYRLMDFGDANVPMASVHASVHGHAHFVCLDNECLVDEEEMQPQVLTVVPSWMWTKDLQDCGTFIMVAGAVATTTEGVAYYQRLDSTTAHIMSGIAVIGTPTFQYEIIKSNMQIRVVNWLAMRGSSSRAGKLNAMTFENVHADFLFWLIGAQWFKDNEGADPFAYNEELLMHEVRGYTYDFVHVFGRDLGEVDENLSEDGTTACTVCSSVQGVKPIIWRYSLRRPGILLLIFVDIQKWGVPRDVNPAPGQQPQCRRASQWHTERFKLHAKKLLRLRPTQST
eukprot:CAMPEP_0181309094 /NCGR_PEP_ID=MMETSP1101-20121128/11831_1 /TAXON_ID=46948 /ORGANISM="Rhodomonas abbreviata, Strain Caron Lab Isolate" /LENGTH=523 /DNA_ID=CAMNT_0023415557 /DNA_START=42 /DNA_END=1613 /DNA_ORIENTATION=-